MQPTIHTFRVAALDGGIIDFSRFQGRKLMVVHTASECGLRPQYARLQELYEHGADRPPYGKGAHCRPPLVAMADAQSAQRHHGQRGTVELPEVPARRGGPLVEVHAPATSPLDDAILDWLRD